MLRILCIGEEEGRARACAALARAGAALAAAVPAAGEAPLDLALVIAAGDPQAWIGAVLSLQGERATQRLPVIVAGEPASRPLALALGCAGWVDVAGSEDELAREVLGFAAGRRDALEPTEEAEARRELVSRLGSALSAAGEARTRMQDLDRRRVVFLQDLVHELSTPLTPLSGYAKILLSDKLGTLDERQHKVVEGMSAAVGRLARIIENLSDFASLQSGKAVLASAPVSPDIMAEEVVAELRPLARDARLHLEVLPSGSAPVLADPRKLRQALANVVSNAVKFSPHGGEVLVEVSREPERLRFAVYDQGPGVHAPEVERIFEPFPHADRADEARRPGSGLGLPVARRIAEAHGGTLVVESPPHTQPSVGAHHFNGSRFILEIPARREAASVATPARVSG